ncbi:MAG: fibronectin type III domain-containing protein [Acidimicrobiales bacterium]
MRRHSASRLALSAAVTTLAAALCVVVGPGPGATGSTPAGPWTVASPPSPSGSWYSVDYGDGQWVVLGHSPEVAVSPDGSTWTEYPVPAGSWQSVSYGHGQFVALSSLDTTPQEMVSTNGSTWSVVSGPAGQWTGLAFGEGRFVAVSSNGQIITSTNGDDWTLSWEHDKYDFTSVAYGGGRFVAVDGSSGAIAVSTNGRSWRLYPTPMAGLRWGAVAYGNANFVAFDSSGSGYVATSQTGYVWAVHQYSPAQATDAAAFGCGDFVAAGGPSASANNFITSSLGETWSAAAVPIDATTNWTSVAYGAHRFVAVDSLGNIATLATSADCAAMPPSPPQQVSGNIHNGEVWTYMHPPASPGGAPVNGYRVTITDGTTTKQCSAPVYFEPNCIIRGLKNHQVYEITAQSHNRFGYSAPTDPEAAIPVASWRFSAAATAPVVAQSSPLVVQVTGVLANGEGIYPSSSITVHVGARLILCRPSPFGECLITVANPGVGPSLIFATYTGYGRSYRSPVSHVTVTP